VDYTHTVIVAIARNLDNDLNAYVQRLLFNQVHLGRFIGSLVKDANFGVAATKLLTEHIVIAKDIVDLANGGQDYSEASERWNENGRQIAAALASKAKWTALLEIDVAADFQKHLNQTLSEAVAILSGDTSKAIVWLDAARRHMHLVGRKLVDAYYR
jgi:hypothetical protein